MVRVAYCQGNHFLRPCLILEIGEGAVPEIQSESAFDVPKTKELLVVIGLHLAHD